MARQTVFPQPLLVLAACGLLAAALVAEQPAPQQPAPAPADAPFRNAALPIESRIDGLLAAMTLDEKLACLQTSTAVPRLGVPDMGGSEGLHQLVRRGGFGPEKPVPTTSFALTLGLGATWDPALLQRAGEAQGVEARYITQHPKYHQPVLVNWLNVDLARDPRWGRYEESYGEDPFLTGSLASAYIRGIQGDHPKYWRAAALLKHKSAEDAIVKSAELSKPGLIAYTYPNAKASDDAKAYYLKSKSGDVFVECRRSVCKAYKTWKKLVHLRFDYQPVQTADVEQVDAAVDGMLQSFAPEAKR